MLKAGFLMKCLVALQKALSPDGPNTRKGAVAEEPKPASIAVRHMPICRSRIRMVLVSMTFV